MALRIVRVSQEGSTFKGPGMYMDPKAILRKSHLEKHPYGSFPKLLFPKWGKFI